MLSPNSPSHAAVLLYVAASRAGTLRRLGDVPGHEFHGNQYTVSGSIIDKHGEQYEVQVRQRSYPGNPVPKQEYRVVNVHGHTVASAELRREKKAVSSVYVNEQRRGIATALYKHIEGHLGYKLEPNPALTDEGKAFWKSRSLGDVPGHEFHGNQYTDHAAVADSHQAEAERLKKEAAFAKGDKAKKLNAQAAEHQFQAQQHRTAHLIREGRLTPTTKLQKEAAKLLVMGDVPGHEFHGNQWTEHAGLAKEYSTSKGTNAETNSALVKNTGVKVNAPAHLTEKAHEAVAHVVSDRQLAKAMEGKTVEVKDLGGKLHGRQSTTTIYIDSKDLEQHGPGFTAAVIRHELEHDIMSKAGVPSGKQEERVRYKTGLWSSLKYSLMAKTNPKAAEGFRKAARDQGIRNLAAREETAVHAAADAHVDKIKVALRYAFAMARKKLPDHDAAAAELKRELVAVLPSALLATLVAGGNAALSLLPSVSLKAAEGDFDEAKHPRDDHGKFTSGGDTAAKKVKPPTATKDQAKLAYDMKMAGASASQIQAATGLTKQQAIKIVWKMNKAQKAEKAAMLGKVETTTTSTTSTGLTGLTAKATESGYTWQEKTAENSPGLQKENAGKYAWFKDGKQVSPPADKTDAEKAAGQMHFGAGPKTKDQAAAEVAAAKVQYNAAEKTFADINTHEPGAGGAVGSWPVSDSVDRQMGNNYPVKLEEVGEKWAGTLTASEKQALASYTSSGYTSINDALRGKEAETPYVKKNIDQINSALSKSPAPPPPELVWRGVSGHDALAFTSNLKPGDAVVMKGFQSTSIRPQFATSWGDHNVLFEIKPNAGGYVRPLSSHKHEYEYLLPHNAKYVVHGATQVKLAGKLTHVVKLEMVQ